MANLTEAQKKAKLIIDPPSELRFRGPFNQPVTTNLKLTNPSDEVILFKIKTTAPKRYCVRPNYGEVPSRGTVTVEISLQPTNYFDPYERCKHKFMIQSIVAPDVEEDFGKGVNIWKELPADRFMDAKLKCVFELPGENEDTTNVKLVKTETIAPPKPKAEEKISNVEISDHSETLANEMRQLREENTNLRKEVLNLKEQVLRVRTSPTKAPVGEPYTPVIVEKQIPIFYIAIAIAAAIFGIILGKFLF
uniref:MSP domain-containing protein n=1 Tax=Glossina austeni TaxID=7395 RepID=A0A1A9UHT7_GLOAU